MNQNDAKSWLEAKLAELNQLASLNAEAQDVVALDQTSVGRLSRMDALQGQAMAKATAQRRLQEKREIERALVRVSEGEWGYCLMCGEDIEPRRLANNPAAASCLGCASGADR